MSLELESFFSSVSSGFTWCSYVFGIVFIICSRLEDVCVCVSILLMVEPIQEPMCNKMLQAKGHQGLCLLRFGGWCSWLRMKSGPLTCDWQVPPQIAHGLSMESHGIPWNPEVGEYNNPAPIRLVCHDPPLAICSSHSRKR
jgi:hypothetical protein